MNSQRLICNSRHQLSDEAVEVELDVVYKPEVRIDHDVVTVEENSELRNIYCNVEANPPASVKWFDTSNPKILYSEQNELRVIVKKESNNKIFECMAENVIGRSNVDSFKLNVLYGPRIVSESNDQQTRLGDSVSLNCQIDANPAPTINWFYLRYSYYFLNY
jgi:hypothetical protein